MIEAETRQGTGVDVNVSRTALNSMDGRRWIICFLAAEEIKQAAREMGIEEDRLNAQVMEDIAYRFSCGVNSAISNQKEMLKDSIREAVR